MVAALSCSRAVINGGSSKSPLFTACNPRFRVSVKISAGKVSSKYACGILFTSQAFDVNSYCSKCSSNRNDGGIIAKDPGCEDRRGNLEVVNVLSRCGAVLAAIICGVVVFKCRRAMAAERLVDAGYGIIGQSILLLRNAWPKTLQVLRVLKEQGLVLALLLGLSAFFSMAETSITTLWPWKVCF